MPEEEAGSPQTSKFPEWAWKVMAMLVIPLIAWGVKLEVNNAVQDDRVATLKTDKTDLTSKVSTLEGTVKVQGERIATLQSGLKEVQKMREMIGANTLELARTGVKIDEIFREIREIKELLRAPYSAP